MVFASFQVAKIHIMKNLRSARTACAIVLLIIILDYYLTGVRSMCSAVDQKVSLWGIVALIFNAADSRCLLFMLFAFFICDLPGRDGAEPYVYQRCGVNAWISGKIIAAALWSCLFVAIVILNCGIVLNRYASLSLEWGKVIRTLAKSDAAEAFQIRLPVSSKMIGLYSMHEAIVYTILLNVMSCIMLAMCMLTLNAWSRKAIGNLVVVGLALLSKEVGGMVLSLEFLKLSPCSWASLEVIGNGNISYRPTIEFVFIAMSGCTLVAIMLLYATRKRVTVYSA